MRNIHKGNHPPYHLEQRCLKEPAQPYSAWHNFSHKEEVRDLLRQEQYCLCAYCEIRLDEIGEHIEHVMPKNNYPEKTFDYGNLVLSCMESARLKLYAREERSCGHSDGKIDSTRFDANLFVSPLDYDCQRFFSYELTGEVEPHPALTPSDKACAEYTINLLNLNSPRLVRRRLALITETVKIIKELSGEALYHFADMDLGLSSDCLQPFHSARLQQFQNFIPHIVEQLNFPLSASG